MKTIIVTGAHGFLGRHSAKRAAELGNRVIGVGHGPWTVDEWRQWGLSGWYEGEITVETLKKCVETPDAIVHLAGSSSVPFSLDNPIEDFRRTVLTTANVMEFARTHSNKPTVVYCSSASIYGSVTCVPISEDIQANPISPYGHHKNMAEQILRYHARQFGVPSAIVRLFSVYGCGLRKQLLWDACRKFSLADARFMGSGREGRDWLHVADAADLLLLAVLKATTECPVVNGGSGEEITINEILAELATYLFPQGQSPQFSGHGRKGDPARLVANIERAKAWGWCPKRNWREGVAEYAAWWLDEHAITCQEQTSGGKALRVEIIGAR